MIPNIGYNTTIWFGKYKGQKAKDIAMTDPTYLFWLHYDTDYELSQKLLNHTKSCLDLLKSQTKPKVVVKKSQVRVTSNSSCTVYLTKTTTKQKRTKDSATKETGTPTVGCSRCDWIQVGFVYGDDYCPICGHCKEYKGLR